MRKELHFYYIFLTKKREKKIELNKLLNFFK